MRIIEILMSSVVRKWMMALTGAFLVFFLVIHLSGNFLIFQGSEVFNAYTHFLTGHSFIYPIEAILVICFLYHACYGIYIRVDAKLKARGQRDYAVKADARGSRRNWASKTAGISGTILLAFIVFHVWTMKFGEPGVAPTERDLYAWVLHRMSNPAEVAFYMFSIFVLGVHLFNGLGTIYESFGIAHRPVLRIAGQIFAIVLSAGFFFLPLILHFMSVGIL